MKRGSLVVAALLGAGLTLGIEASSGPSSSATAPTTYYYQVAAVNAAGIEGPRSNEVAATPLAADPALLADGYATLKTGTLYKTWAKSNPGEASRLASFIATILQGGPPVPPPMATATGKGFVQWASMGLGG